MRPAIFFVSVFFVTLCAQIPAQAEQRPSIVGEYKYWTAFTYKEKNSVVCFISASPRKWTSKPKNVRRGDIFFLVTHRPALKTRNEASVYTGYTYKAKSEVIVDIDGQKFRLFTDKNTAWARDAKTDQKLIAAMRAGGKMLVTGTSSRGTVTRDTYSLAGVTAAHKAINKACR